MFDDARGFIICSGLAIPEGIDVVTIGNDMWMVDRRLHKFKGDEILQKEGNEWFFFDGYILNKEEICQSKNADAWDKAFIMLMRDENCPEKLRGGFCGFWGKGRKYTLFVDHVGNRGLYYYCRNDVLVFSSNFYFIIELLKYNHISLTVSEQAVKYMLEQGFMLDDSTFANEIKRVCPGEVVEIRDNRIINKKKYYLIDNTEPDYNMTEEEAIDKIDFYFRQAVKREFDKDKEYGYRYLVDLSGGLDSRMVCWCAHKMGYTEQVNFTYCRQNYLDFKIAQKIAIELKHTFLFMPLDDLQWYKEVDEVLKKNNGAALYSGITGGNRFLGSINCVNFGIEHTGMVGDAILSTFYDKEEYNYEKPVGNENAHSQIVRYDIPPEVFTGYENREQFSVYTRGLLGAQSSYFIRQNYIETSSPFLDVDFLNFVFKIPFEYRKKHYIYLKWLANKYPEAAEFGWEKWFGIKPKWSNLWLKRVVNTTNKYVTKINRISGHESNRGMNPYDYWLSNDVDLQNWVNNCFRDNEIYLESIPNMKDDVKKVFDHGNASEMSQAITALLMIKYIVI